MDNVTTSTGEPVTAPSLDELEKLFKELKELPEPQALILIPSMKGFDMYKVDAKHAKTAVQMCAAFERNPGLFPEGLVK